MIKSRYTELYFSVVTAVVVLSFWGTTAQGRGISFKARDIVENANQSYHSSFESAYLMGTMLAYSMPDSSGSLDRPMSTAGDTSIQGSTFFPLSPADTAYLEGFKAYQVIEYAVQPGDTIGEIASNFDVTINTIVWANNLKNPNVLSLGDVLKIPPVDGVIHKVQSGDTVASIAKKYKADSDKILSFNSLAGDQNLQIGDELLVPGGQLAGPLPSVKAIAKGTSSLGIYVPTNDGQCVSFVQAHGFSQLHGNAKDWVKYENTETPQVGGVVVFGAGSSYGRYGHVAIITAVKADTIQVVEQNFYPKIKDKNGKYVGVVDHREVPLSDAAIVAFIK